MGTITGIGVSRCLVGCAVIALSACYGPRDPQTAEEKTRRGDELMTTMSDTLAAAQGLSFSLPSRTNGGCGTDRSNPTR